MLSWLALFTSCAAAVQVRTAGNLRALGQDVGVLVSRIAAQPASFEVTRNLGQGLGHPQDIWKRIARLCNGVAGLQ